MKLSRRNQHSSITARHSTPTFNAPDNSTDVRLSCTNQHYFTFVGSVSEISAVLWPLTSSIEMSGAEGASEGAFERSIFVIRQM